MADSGLLSEETENLLTQKKPELLRTIRLTPMFWASLSKHGVVSIREIGEIQRTGTATPQTQIDELLDHVIMGTNQRYMGFLGALAEAGQEYVVTQVLQEEVSETMATPETSKQGRALSTESGQQVHSSKGAQASAASPLPPWDKSNREEQMAYDSSPYQDVLNNSRVELVQYLEDEAIWPHLRMMGVMSRVDEEHIKYNKSRPERVEELLNFIEMGPRWHFHCLFRAMTLTDQTSLIPEGGVDKAVYTQGCQSDHQGSAPLKLLSKDVLRVIRDHCQSYQTSLMRRHVFDFGGDAGDDVIDISSCIINVDPYMKSASQMQSIPTSQILEQLHDEIPPRVIRLYADPGDGKTSLMRHIPHHWSTTFPQLIENDQYITAEPLSWTTLVYLEARKITTTVDAAIREGLGCKVEDTDILMNHIRTGQRVGVLLDSIDELRNQAAIEEVKRYVHERKMKGGPTVLMSARTDICPIDAQDIDRFLTLQGFTEDEGIQYVKKYTKMYRLSDHAVNQYVVKHREDLQPVLTNPLRLYLFSALAIRGEIKLEEDAQFNISNIFQPLERYLLRRSGTEVTEQQSSDFYRMCLWGLLTGVREFSETHLAHFNISQAYHVFLQRSDRRRSEDGVLVPYYTFSHEMTYEYFGGCYIKTRSRQQKEAILILICKNKYLRNLQKIVFQILHQDCTANSKLMQLMIRCICALQDKRDRPPGETHLCGLIQSDSSPEDMLYSNEQEFSATEASAVCKQINNAFDISSEVLREKAAFHDMKVNGTIQHVVNCLQVCTAGQRRELLQHTIFHLLPCFSGTIWYFQTGETQWEEVHDKGNAHTLRLKTLLPRHAGEMLAQYLSEFCRISNPQINFASINLGDKDCTLWGVPSDCSWSKEEWHTLFNTLGEHHVNNLVLSFASASPLTGLLRCILAHAAALHSMRITVQYGSIPLHDLVSLLPACQRAGLDVFLHYTRVVVPHNMEPSTFRLQKVSLCELECKDTYGMAKMLRTVLWMTEDGEYISGLS